MRYFYLFFLTLVLVSCGTDSHHFKIDGRLLNLNQGEFYVYSTDGIIDDVDTIHVEAGRFTYEIECGKVGTLVIVFPNFSEQPVFTQPGKSVSFEGDAHNMKELKVKGTKENEVMNTFRQMTTEATAKETKRCVETIVQNNPQSIVPPYLIRKHLIQAEEPDYKLAAKLCTALQKEQPENGRLKILAKQLKGLSASAVNNKLPAIKATDIDGKKIKTEELRKGKAVIYVWSSWEYESCNMQRAVRDMMRTNDNLHAIGICLDLSKKDCRRIIERDEITCPIVCTEKMLDTPLLSELGLYYIPDNLILENGKIVARNLTTGEMRKRLQP